MRIAVVDSQDFFRERVKDILLRRFANSDIFLYSNFSELSNDIYFDLLLIEIEMPTESGLSFAKRNHLRFPYIIYVTSNDGYIYDAFDTNIIGYILKSKIEQTLLDKIEQLFKVFEKENQLILITDNGLAKFREKDIMRFYYEENEIYMRLYTGSVIRIVTKSLVDVKKNLSCVFFQVNRNNLINIRYITCYCEDSILMINEAKEIPVSRRKRKELNSLYAKVRLYNN